MVTFNVTGRVASKLAYIRGRIQEHPGQLTTLYFPLLPPASSHTVLGRAFFDGPHTERLTPPVHGEALLVCSKPTHTRTLAPTRLSSSRLVTLERSLRDAVAHDILWGHTIAPRACRDRRCVSYRWSRPRSCSVHAMIGKIVRRTEGSY